MDAGKGRFLVTSGGIVNWGNHCEDQGEPSKIENILPYKQAVPLLGICPKDLISYFIDTCSAMSVVAFFTIAKKRKATWLHKIGSGYKVDNENEAYVHYEILFRCREK